MAAKIRARAASLLTLGGSPRHSSVASKDEPKSAPTLDPAASFPALTAVPSSAAASAEGGSEETSWNASLMPEPVGNGSTGPRHVRVVPTWVADPYEDDGNDTSDPSSALLAAPPDVQIAHHNSMPSPLQNTRSASGKSPARGETSANGSPAAYRQYPTHSRWRDFIHSTAYPRLLEEQSQRVPQDWLLEHGDYQTPWQGGEANVEKGPSSTQHRVWWKRFQRILLSNPMVPLILRMVILCFSLIALGLGARIYMDAIYSASRRSSSDSISGLASPLMAIIVDAVAPVYLIWVTRDEYTGKPLGLRSPRSKTRLVLCDVFFIVFDAANLSLAFDSAREDWLADYRLSDDDRADGRLQWTLATVLLVALVAWIMTFSVSVLRLVERVSR